MTRSSACHLNRGRRSCCKRTLIPLDGFSSLVSGAQTSLSFSCSPTSIIPSCSDLYLLIVVFLVFILNASTTAALTPAFSPTYAPQSSWTTFPTPNSAPAPAQNLITANVPAPDLPVTPAPAKTETEAKAPEPAPAKKSTPSATKQSPPSKDSGSPSSSSYMEAIAARRHGGGKKEGILAGVVFSCIFALLFIIGSAYIYMTRKYNLDRTNSMRSEASQIDGEISAAVPAASRAFDKP